MSEAVQDLFDQWAREGRDLKMSESHKYAVRQALMDLEVPEDAAILDVGCGNGYAVRALARRLPDASVMGIDFSDGMIVRARAATPDDLFNAVFMRGTIYDEGMEGEQFDLIYSIEALYYMSPVADTLTKLVEMLAGDGQLVVVVDYYAENQACHDWPKKYGVEMELLSSDDYLLMFRRNGLEDVSVAFIKDPNAEEAWKRNQGSLVIRGKKAVKLDADFLLGGIDN